MPAIYMNRCRAIHQHKTGQVESFLSFSNQNWEEKTSLRLLVQVVKYETMTCSPNTQKVVRKQEAGRTRSRWEGGWRVLEVFKLWITVLLRPSGSLYFSPFLDMQDTPVSSQVSSHLPLRIQTGLLSFATKIDA